MFQDKELNVGYRYLGVEGYCAAVQALSVSLFDIRFVLWFQDPSPASSQILGDMRNEASATLSKKLGT